MSIFVEMSIFVGLPGPWVLIVRQLPVPNTRHGPLRLLGDDVQGVFRPPQGGPCDSIALGCIFDFLLGYRAMLEQFAQQLDGLVFGRWGLLSTAACMASTAVTSTY
jgi:hypothetical protein